MSGVVPDIFALELISAEGLLHGPDRVLYPSNLLYLSGRLVHVLVIVLFILHLRALHLLHINQLGFEVGVMFIIDYWLALPQVGFSRAVEQRFAIGLRRLIWVSGSVYFFRLFLFHTHILFFCFFQNFNIGLR